MAVFILAAIVAAALVTARAGVSSEERMAARAKPGFWRDQDQGG